MRKYFLGKLTPYSQFFPILHHSLPLLCLGIICWLDACVIEFILNSLISMFLCEVDARMSIFFSFFFWYENKLISFQLYCAWRCYFPILVFTSNIGFFLAIGKQIWEFFRFPGNKGSKSRNTSHVSLLSIPCCLSFSHCSSFFVVMLGCYLLNACMY